MANDSDPDGDSISFYGIVSNPTHGSLTGGLAPDRKNYTPAQGYVGSDSFTYRISDNLSGISNTATVTLNVVNNAPVPVADFYVVRGNTIVGPMLINDYDPDNDGIADFTLVTAPAHGSLAIAGQADTKWFYPTVGYFGWDSFTYKVRDGLYLWSTATVFVLILPGSDPTPTTCSCPYDPAASVPSNPAQGGFLGLGSENASSPGPSGPDPVNLTTGREAYMPAPDLTVYNPNGPGVFWQRGYLGYQSLLGVTGYGSPGLARGWVQGYDVTIQGTAGSWGTLKLSYPSGATENLTPTLSGGQPTGAFTTVAGAPYIVNGVAGTPTGTWQSVTITWKDQTKWKFTLFSGTTYTLSQITSRTSQSINFSWNSSRALTQITDATTSTVLLTLAYGSNGKLATATDVYGRQIAYTFTAGTGTSQSMLQAVSQLVTSGTANPPAHWTYTYTTDKGQQLYTISVPSPTGSGNSTATINYDSVGKVTSLVDANGNQRVYTYNSGTTQVQVKDSASNVALSWTQKFNTGGLDTGITDAGSHSTTNAYTDTANPLS